VCSLILSLGLAASLGAGRSIKSIGFLIGA